MLENLKPNTLEDLEQSTFYIPKEQYLMRLKAGLSEVRFIGNLKHLINEVNKITELGVTYQVSMITLDAIGINSRTRGYKKGITAYLQRMQQNEEYKLNNMIQ